MWPRREPAINRTVILVAIIGALTAVSITAIVTFGGQQRISATSSAFTRPTTGADAGGSEASSRRAPAVGPDRGVRSARARHKADITRAAVASAFAPTVCCVLSGASSPNGGAATQPAAAQKAPDASRVGGSQSAVRSSGRHLRHHLLKRRLVRSHERRRGRHRGKRSQQTVGHIA